jgi:hypothetical protein
MTEKQEKCKEFRFYSRKFLNRKEGSALTEVHVSASKSGWGVEASLGITDCYRRVGLDFNFDIDHKQDFTQGRFVDAKAKVARLRAAIDELEFNMDVAMDVATRNWELNEPKRKAEKAAAAKRRAKANQTSVDSSEE